MKEYFCKIQISKEEFDHINQLFEIDFDDESEEMTKRIRELNAVEDSFYKGFFFKFEDGTEISLDIHSGCHNYYDDWFVKTQDEEDSVDCCYELAEDTEIYWFENDEKHCYHCQFEII